MIFFFISLSPLMPRKSDIDIAKLLLEHKTRTISQFPDVKGCFKRSFIHTLPPIILALVVLASFLFNSSSFPS